MKGVQPAVGSPDFLGHVQVSGVQVSITGVWFNIWGVHRSGRDTKFLEEVLLSRLLGRRIVFFFQGKRNLPGQKRECLPVTRLYYFQEAGGDLGWKERSTGHTCLKGKEETGWVRNQTKIDVGKGRKEQLGIASEECGFVPLLKRLTTAYRWGQLCLQNVTRE